MGLRHHEKIKIWNRGLEAAVKTFQSAHNEATVLLYSSWSLFCRVYKEPGIYGFEKSDTQSYSAMWADNVHPSTAMHEIIGVDIGEFLSELQVSS
jgi:phospholipase/lecithinase/hemolysin